MNNNVSFSFGALKMPTPTKIIWYARIYSACAGVLLTGMESAPFISAHTQMVINWFLGISIALVNAVAPFFGVQTDQQKVSISDVSALDENAVKK